MYMSCLQPEQQSNSLVTCINRYTHDLPLMYMVQLLLQ